ncbi:MAG: hypothetical protein IH986_01865 [Planctomycetes bacterium]|nr:hypothetical protein [Planctomycetota bacterium]
MLESASVGMAVALASVALSQEVPADHKHKEVKASVAAAKAFMLRAQNEDGSWGGYSNPAIGFDEFWSNPETHRAWTFATTSLVCIAILDMPRSGEMDAAYSRGIDFLMNQGLVRRPSEWDVDNTWAYVYGVQAFARAVADGRVAGTSRHEELRSTGQALINKLLSYQTPSGGWGYYDFDAYTRRPAWATSFMTAVGVIALLEARQAGFEVDANRLSSAVRAVERCKLPNGAYSYSVEAVPSPGRATGINQVKGSLSRIQVCNLALLLAERKLSNEALRRGLDQFFTHHRFLDVARKKPIPHEAYYANSGYFYFFGHYYAALVIQQLPVEDRARYWSKLQHEIIKTQEKDGSMWDYYMNSYHKPYGVAFSVMALQGSLAVDVPAAERGNSQLRPAP